VEEIHNIQQIETSGIWACN